MCWRQIESDLPQDDSQSTCNIHQYDTSLQQPQHALINPNYSSPVASHVIANSYSKFDDVRYSAVRSAPDVNEEETVNRCAERHHHHHHHSVDNMSVCTCANTPCFSIKYAPHLTTVAELEMENSPPGNYTMPVYSCTS